MTVETVRQCTKVKKKWRILMQMLMIEFYAAIFSWFMSSFRPPSSRPRAGGLSASELWDAVT